MVRLADRTERTGLEFLAASLARAIGLALCFSLRHGDTRGLKVKSGTNEWAWPTIWRKLAWGKSEVILIRISGRRGGPMPSVCGLHFFPGLSSPGFFFSTGTIRSPESIRQPSSIDYSPRSTDFHPILGTRGATKTNRRNRDGRSCPARHTRRPSPQGRSSPAQSVFGSTTSFTLSFFR